MLLAYLGGLTIAFTERRNMSNYCFSCGAEFGMQHSNSLLGLVLALNGAFMAAGYMLIVRKLSGKIDTFSYTAIIYSIVTLFLLLIVIFEGDEFFACSYTV